MQFYSNYDTQWSLCVCDMSGCKLCASKEWVDPNCKNSKNRKGQIVEVHLSLSDKGSKKNHESLDERRTKK